MIFEILSMGSKGVSKTQLIAKGNLSFQMAERYLTFLIERGYLRLDLQSNGYSKYVSTAKGERLLLSLANIRRDLSGLFPEPHTSRLRESLGHYFVTFGPKALDPPFWWQIGHPL